MGDMTKAVKLYTMMAARCEKTGSLKQARVYREMVDFLGLCENTSDAMEKIKNSRYYLAPSVALVEDKIEFLKRASLQNNMPELARIYEEKLSKISDNIEEIYDMAYETTAQNIKSRYLKTMEAFLDIYSEYINLSCRFKANKKEISESLGNICQKEKLFDLPASSFTDISKMQYFRGLISCKDEEYSRFVKTISDILKGNWDDYLNANAEIDDINKEFDENFKCIKNMKKEIIQAGKENAKKTRRSRIMVVAPDGKGPYTYIRQGVEKDE